MNVKWIVSVLFTCLTSLALSSSVLAQSVDVAVVVSAHNPVRSVSLGELRKIFAGEKRSWPGGLPVTLIVRPLGCHERLVLLKLLGMSESEYKQYWTSQVLRGEASSEPFAAPSVGILREALTVFPGAISLGDAHQVKPGMKILGVDGHFPGDSAYSVH